MKQNVQADKTTARLRMKRFRSAHPRIDYSPAPDLLEWIEHVKANNPGVSYGRVIDHLLRTAKKAIAGNVAGNKPAP